MEHLETEIVELQNLAESTRNQGHIEDLKSKKSALTDLLGTKAQGAVVRSRFQSATLMDAPSKFFFGLEKKNGQSRFLHALHSATGQELRDSNEIRRRAVCFYSKVELRVKTHCSCVSIKKMKTCLDFFVKICPNSLKTPVLFLKDFNKSHILSAYADDVIIFLSRRIKKKVEEIIKDFEIISAAKINWKKSEALAVGSWRGVLPSLPGGLVWKDSFKYLGVYVGNETIVQKNCEGVVEKVEGRLNKWKWLKPQMSFRGRALIINNLVASALWHRLACMEPPKGLIQRLQAILVDFFWDRLHWVLETVLFLPKEEGGKVWYT